MIASMGERRNAPAERRQGQRIPFVASVLKKVGRETSLALAQDLCETGMQLKRVAGRSYLPRTPLTLAFELPDGGELVRVRGAVVFERAEGSWHTVGVQFEMISLSDRQRIARYLDARLR
jgi:hypothetical protein